MQTVDYRFSELDVCPRPLHHSHADTRRPATGPPAPPTSSKAINQKTQQKLLSSAAVGLLCKELHMVQALSLCYGLFHADEGSYLALFKTFLCYHVSHHWTRLCLLHRLAEILSIHCFHEDRMFHHNSCIRIPSINLLPASSSHPCSNTPTGLETI